MNAAERVLELWKRLSAGESLELRQLKNKFNKSEIQLKRDIQCIRNTFGQNAVKYDRDKNFYFSLETGNNLTVGDALLLLLLLYNSRSLEKEECRSIANSIISRFSDKEQVRLRKFFQSFNARYESITEFSISEYLSSLFAAILEQQKVSFHYPVQSGGRQTNELNERMVEPLMLVYQKGCFYLLAEEEKKKKHYRIDRMSDLKVLEIKYRLKQGSDYLDVGEYHNRTFNMFSGDRMTVRLKVAEHAIEYLKRECPRFKILQTNKEDRIQIVEIETLGEDGILFWILSQQDWVEVLAPQKFRNRIAQITERMAQLYRDTHQD